MYGEVTGTYSLRSVCGVQIVARYRVLGATPRQVILARDEAFLTRENVASGAA